MVGERGPELFVPGSNGGIMRNEDMRQMMGRSPASAVAPQMNFSFETTNIGGTEYVSREQLKLRWRQRVVKLLMMVQNEE